MRRVLLAAGLVVVTARTNDLPQLHLRFPVASTPAEPLSELAVAEPVGPRLRAALPQLRLRLPPIAGAAPVERPMEVTDGYADTDGRHPRLEAPDGDPEGDHRGWGPGLESAERVSTPSGEMPENFSIITKLLGPCDTKTCPSWSLGCLASCAVSFLLMTWAFKNLKVISDVYFVPSTLAVSRQLKMPADVAGATLLAFGSSAPEFCTNVVATFFIVNECGVGDIIGSAIHNVLLIVGVSGLCAGRALALWWYPLSRDCFFYALSILELTVFLWDEHVTVLEASVMCLTYFLYIAWMMRNMSIYYFICDVLRLKATVPDEGSDDDDEEEGGILDCDPLEIFWKYTMPSAKTSAASCFLASLLHISWLAYLMVDAATHFGCSVGMPPLFMGLVFLAAGTSIPDAFASMAAARKGEGDMAVSNALGSNIFDILLGLGFPWLIALLLGKPIVFLGVNRLLYWVLILVAVLVAFMVVVIGGGWQLGKRMGATLVALYGGYVLFALLKAFDVIA